MKALGMKGQDALSGSGSLPMELEDLPKPPKGYRWRGDEFASQIKWKYLEHAKTKETKIWMVRDKHGTPCAGVMNHNGYRLMPGDEDTIIIRLLTMEKLGLLEKMS